jgi:hypothetical protein
MEFLVQAELDALPGTPAGEVEHRRNAEAPQLAVDVFGGPRWSQPWNG